MYSDATPPVLTAEAVLDGVAGVREQQRLLDRGMVVFAVEWAKLNPNYPPPDGFPEYDEDQWLFDQITAAGALSFDASTASTFAIRAGLSEYSAKKLIRESVMLVHFLPLVWARVLAGKQDVWRARLLAGDCYGLSLEAVKFVDEHMSARNVRITATSRERIIDEARSRHMPEEAAHAVAEARNRRGVEIFSHTNDLGVMQLHGELDYPDATALDVALAHGARVLKEAGCDAPLGTRRAWALGDLARMAMGGESLYTITDPLTGEHSAHRPRWNGRGAPVPSVKLFIHLPSSEFFTPTPGSITGDSGSGSGSFGVVQGSDLSGQHIIDTGTVRNWFTRSSQANGYVPQIFVRPVINLNAEAHTGAYEPTEGMREQVHLTTDECIFPFCTRSAHRCDVDHTTPWREDGSGGATCTCNLAPLCRTHHRVKTHGDNASDSEGQHSRWSYVHLGAQEYFWSGPRGTNFIRTPHGTYDANATQNNGAPPHPGSAGAPLPPVDLGEGPAWEDHERVITKLLDKASLTRGAHKHNYAPLWATPPTPRSDDPPEQYLLDGEIPNPIMFHIPAPEPGTPQWNTLIERWLAS